MMRHAFKLFHVWVWGSTLLLLAATGTVIGFLLVRGWAGIGRELVFGETPVLAALMLQRPVFDGLFPAMVGTLALVLLSVGMALPVGLATGIYLAEYATGRLYSLLSLFFDILAGMPSIVVGLFGFSITIFLHHRFSGKIYPCLFISALSLAVLVLPYLIRTTQAALEAIPADLRLIGPSLGATRFQNIFHVLVPHSLKSILSGILLAIGRCAEDTAVIMLTGVVVSAGIPKSIWGNFEALPFYIYYISAQYADADELTRGYGAAIILLLLCAFLFGIAFWLQRRLSQRWFERV